MNTVTESNLPLNQSGRECGEADWVVPWRPASWLRVRMLKPMIGTVSKA
jgi:hypothetical protein